MKIPVALLTIAAACALSPGIASAQGYPVCLRGCDFGAGDCSYSTYAQCQASASGRVGWCDANPDYHPVSVVQPVGHPRVSRRSY
jgi:hypothetical protein